MTKRIIAKQFDVRIARDAQWAGLPFRIENCSHALLLLGIFASMMLLYQQERCWAQGGGFVTLAPIDKAVLTPTPPPTFVWQGPTAKKVTLQFSTDPNFPKKGTLSVKVAPQTSEGNNVIALDMKRWERKVLKKLRREVGTDDLNPIFWRIAVGKGKAVQLMDGREMAVKNATRAVLSGRAFDGANLNGDGIQTTITLKQVGGDGIPVLNDGTSTFPTNADGTYSVGFNATARDQIFIVDMAAQSFQTMSRAFRLSDGAASPYMYLSDTVIAGKVLDTSGNPIPNIDI